MATSIKSLHEKLRADSGSFQRLQQGTCLRRKKDVIFFCLSLSLAREEEEEEEDWRIREQPNGIFTCFHSLETELQANVEARKTFTQQATENEMVLEELKSLEAGANVYKLIGPMLAKQDVVEATSNVTKRLEFINAERYESWLFFSTNIVYWAYMCILY